MYFFHHRFNWKELSSSCWSQGNLIRHKQIRSFTTGILVILQYLCGQGSASTSWAVLATAHDFLLSLVKAAIMARSWSRSRLPSHVLIRINACAYFANTGTQGKSVFRLFQALPRDTDQGKLQITLHDSTRAYSPVTSSPHQLFPSSPARNWEVWVQTQTSSTSPTAIEAVWGRFHLRLVLESAICNDLRVGLIEVRGHRCPARWRLKQQDITTSYG